MSARTRFTKGVFKDSSFEPSDAAPSESLMGETNGLNLGRDFSARALNFPKLHITYLPIAKVANTEIKLFLALKAGVPASQFSQSDWPHATSSLGVHHDENFLRLTNSSYVGPDSLEIPSGNLSFSVVRNPVDRLISSWHQLILFEDPHLWAMGRPPPDELRLPPEALADQVIVLGFFEKFLRSEYFRVLRETDVHFMSQRQLMGGFFGKILTFSLDDGLDVLITSIERHLGAGKNLSNLSMRNRGVGKFFNRANLSSAVWNEVMEEYSSDEFPDIGLGAEESASSRRVPPIPSDNLGWDAQRFIEEIRDRNRRIYVLWQSGKVPQAL
jgi:hypothetical protein